MPQTSLIFPPARQPHGPHCTRSSLLRGARRLLVHLNLCEFPPPINSRAGLHTTSSHIGLPCRVASSYLCWHHEASRRQGRWRLYRLALGVWSFLLEFLHHSPESVHARIIQRLCVLSLRSPLGLSVWSLSASLHAHGRPSTWASIRGQRARRCRTKFLSQANDLELALGQSPSWPTKT